MQLEQQIETLVERLNALAVENEALRRENKILRAELQAFRLGLFGRRSERLDPGQLLLIETGEALPPPIEESSEAAARPAQQAKGHGRALFPEHLPRETVELDVPESDRICPDCGSAMKPMGEDTCERGHIVPAKLVVRRYVKKKYGCPDGHAVKTAAAPDSVIDGGKYEASVYAHIATAKYADHLPLHRLEGIFKRYGVQISKQSMWDMLARVDELVAQPVLAEMRRQLLEEPVLHSDETPVTMRLEGGKGTSQGYAWGWRSLREAEQPKVLIEFRPSRGRDGPLQFLGGWAGTLLTDGYSGFDEVTVRNDIVRAGCWAHARRKFKEALEVESKAAAHVLRPIQRLFWIERAIGRRIERAELDVARGITLRRTVREKRSTRVIAAIYHAAERLEHDRATLPKSKLAKAIGYLVRQRAPLSVFLADARIPIHNNDAERDLRHIAIGRKNWLVFASERGGEVACRLYSLVLSCKQAGVDPELYIEDVLGKVSSTPASRIADLTPWGWAAARERAATTAAN